MRRVTRNLVVGILVVVLLLALGALPSYLRSGDPYYVVAEQPGGSHPSVNASTYDHSHYPYTTAAIRTGRSDPYWKGPVGFKEAFTHSPFDEFGALAQRNADAREGETVWVTQNGTLYRLTITQRP
ncbi:MAG: hypothetical protein ABEJ06_04800 [Haloarculaceae archaeon]